MADSRIRVAMFVVLALTGCGGGATVAPIPPTTPKIVTLGDSITVGVSTTMTVHGGYAPLVADALQGSLTNLAIVGEVIGPLDAGTYGGVQVPAHGGVLADEVPGIPTDASVVTLYIGINDLWLYGVESNAQNADAATLLTDMETAYATNMTKIVAAIRHRAPAARLVIATVPNTANRQYQRGWPIRAQLSEFARAMKTAIVGTGATVVDLLCDPAMYDEANFQGQYDVHPNDAGHAAIARDFIAAIQGTAPPVGHCAYEYPM